MEGITSIMMASRAMKHQSQYVKVLSWGRMETTVLNDLIRAQSNTQVYLCLLFLWGSEGGNIYTLTNCGTKMATTGNENIIKTKSHRNSSMGKYMEAKKDGTLQQ
jgi:hypothetical protein